MLLQSVIAGGAVWVGTQRYKNHKKTTRNNERINFALTTSGNTRFRRPRLIDTLSVSKDRCQPANPSILTNAKYIAEELFGDTRQQYQESLGATNEIVAQQVAIEQGHKHNLKVAATGLALATVGTWLTPFFYLPSIGCVLYAFRGFYQDTYHILVRERRFFDYRILQAVMITGALLAGFAWVAALGAITALVNHFLVTKTESRSQQTLADLFGGQVDTVWVLVDGQEVETPVAQVESGDTVVVQAGQMVPVDGAITQGAATIDQHTLTGESQPVEKDVGDSVLASTIVLSGRICIAVQKAGDATVAAQIGEMLTHTDDFKQLLHSRSEHLANQIIVPMMGLSLVALPITGVSGALAVLWYYPGFKMLTFGPLSMLSFLQTAAQDGILIKDGRSLETLHDVDMVVFDKTGTLTLEQPTVSRIFCANDLSEDDLLRYAAAAETKQSHPIACAILHAARIRNLVLPAIDDVDYTVGYGLNVQVAGHTVAVGSIRFLGMAGIPVPPEIEAQQEISHAEGHSIVLVAVDNICAGAIELQATIRPEAKAIIASLRARQIDTLIISGDHEAPTKRLANQLGIERYIAQVLPEDKSNLVAHFQNEGHTVCFVGDGINDSIALKKADASISLCGATTIATDVAQIVLMDGTLRQLAHLFELADEFHNNMRTNLFAATIPNIAGITGTLLFGWGMAVSAWLTQIGTPIGFHNAIKPLLNRDSESEKAMTKEAS